MSGAVASYRVYLDEDVDVLLSRLLAAQSVDCVTTVEVGRLGRADENQLRFASQEGRIVVTHNRLDYERLAVAWHGVKAHAGIVLAMRRSDTHALCRRVLATLTLFPPDAWGDLVLYA